MVIAPRRAPSAVMATAAWTCLWVSTPMMTSAGLLSFISGPPGGFRGPAIQRADRTVMGRGPSSSYQVTFRWTGERRLVDRHVNARTRGQSQEGSGQPGDPHSLTV